MVNPGSYIIVYVDPMGVCNAPFTVTYSSRLRQRTTRPQNPKTRQPGATPAIMTRCLSTEKIRHVRISKIGGMSVAENGGIVETHHIPCLLSYVYIYTYVYIYIHCVVPPSQYEWEMKVYRVSGS